MAMSLPFDDRCPAFRAATLLGDKWTLMILRDLLIDGPRRFQDFHYDRTGMAPNTLSGRLKALEGAGVIEKQLYSEHPPRYVYALTSKGLALEPVLAAMRDWGAENTVRSFITPSSSDKGSES